MLKFGTGNRYFNEMATGMMKVLLGGADQIQMYWLGTVLDQAKWVILQLILSQTLSTEKFWSINNLACLSWKFVCNFDT